MRGLVMMGCLWMLSLCSLAQGSSRIASGTPLRWGMNGSIEVMEGDLARYYGSNDTANAMDRRNVVTANPLGNPHATRFASVQAQCNHNSMQVKWVAIQQPGSDRYQLEQSQDGRNWEVVSTIYANRSDLGESSYSMDYNKNVGRSIFRITATDIAGERTFSSTFQSPCSNDAYLSITPNPVYSSTTVRVGSPSASKVRWQLVSASGSIVQTSNANLAQGINHIPINMSQLPAGNYTLVISWINGKQEMLQLVKL